MKTTKRKHGKAWKCAASMPPLYHKLPDHPFDYAKSEVVNWLLEQPEILEAMWRWYRDNGAIVFRDGRWHGAENGETR